MGIFVTGTDTGVGKTVVTAALADALRRRNLRVGVMKPVETGCIREEDRLVPRDALRLLEASGSSASLDLVNPYALAQPLAPALAAEVAGIHIDPGRILSCYRQLAAEHDVMLVEGAGGLMVPITARRTSEGHPYTMLDLAADLRLPLLVVARNILGVINHTALTVAVARQHGLAVLGVVLNHPSPKSDRATKTNAESLRRWSGTNLLAEIPFVQSPDGDTLRSLGERLEIDRLLEAVLHVRNL
jgi:dethiobiotin synthetase